MERTNPVNEQEEKVRESVRTLKSDVQKIKDWLTVDGQYPVSEVIKDTAGLLVGVVGLELLLAAVSILER